MIKEFSTYRDLIKIAYAMDDSEFGQLCCQEITKIANDLLEKIAAGATDEDRGLMAIKMLATNMQDIREYLEKGDARYLVFCINFPGWLENNMEYIKKVWGSSESLEDIGTIKDDQIFFNNYIREALMTGKLPDKMDKETLKQANEKFNALIEELSHSEGGEPR